MILVWTGTADISNQVIRWADVGVSAVMYAAVFLPFWRQSVTVVGKRRYNSTEIR